ncbi:50S ribosomal protein L13 [Candidatus Curtissbacteria bacterium]|nr:50S ribosomal protein L13 [Candidatus Curtissbacteria bacterium]
MKIKNVKPGDIQRNWHLIDAKGKVIGRVASDIASILMGKNKHYYTPYLDTGDYVVVLNAVDANFTGKKESQKKYYRHSGYPGGLYVKGAAQVRKEKPEQLLRHAVSGMLPKTKLGKMMIKKLFVFPNADHPYVDKFKS